MADGCLLPAVRSRYRVISLMRRGARRPGYAVRATWPAYAPGVLTPRNQVVSPLRPRRPRGLAGGSACIAPGPGEEEARVQPVRSEISAPCWRPAGDLLATCWRWQAQAIMPLTYADHLRQSAVWLVWYSICIAAMV
jgi:hypothetical protein